MLSKCLPVGFGFCDLIKRLCSSGPVVAAKRRSSSFFKSYKKGYAPQQPAAHQPVPAASTSVFVSNDQAVTLFVEQFIQLLLLLAIERCLANGRYEAEASVFRNILAVCEIHTTLSEVETDTFVLQSNRVIAEPDEVEDFIEVLLTLETVLDRVVKPPRAKEGKVVIPRRRHPRRATAASKLTKTARVSLKMMSKQHKSRESSGR